MWIESTDHTILDATIKGDNIGLHWSIPIQFEGQHVELIEDKICVGLDNKQGGEEENYKDRAQAFDVCRAPARLRQPVGT